jgi:hypothetical protein
MGPEFFDREGNAYAISESIAILVDVPEGY